MIIYLDDNTPKYEVENICRMFFPFERVSIAYGQPETDRYVYVSSHHTVGGRKIYARICLDGKIFEDSTVVPTENSSIGQLEFSFAALLFPMLTSLTSIRPSWGLLTGIRPVKLLRQLAAEKGLQGAADSFRKDWLVTDKKISLAMETERHESKILSLSVPESFSLYISIPFCPSRCRYCSFVSHSIEMARHLLPEYVDYICKEIKSTAAIAKGLGLRLETVYMGGGTPTTLSPEQLEKILKTVSQYFDLSHLREFTVEAGRPDTITKEKLVVLKNCSVGRISINPQTLNPEVLAETGRKHTVGQFYDAYSMAKQVGFDCINTDLIAGLHGDNPESFKNTVEGILELRPENITIHTLSIKRAADLGGSGHVTEQYISVEHMIDNGYSILERQGYHPYYLYRQKNTASNLENTGFCLDNKEGFYNVYIMDETHSIFAVGAGGVTKLKNPVTGNIKRIFNYKYPYEYINGFDEMIRRKEEIANFYNQV